MLRKYLQLTSYILLSILLSSCSSMQISDMFVGYNQKMQAVHNAQLKGDFSHADSLVKSHNTASGSYALSLLERGRLQYLANNWQASEESLAQVYSEIKTNQESANIQLSRGVDNVGALISNDNALRYDIPLYEQGMLHSYQALNYLFQRDFEGALVEVRRANLVQEQALKANQNSLYEAQEKMAKNGVSTDSLDKSYPSMSAIIGDLKNGFQNAYTFYLSGLLYEGAGELNDAYIDYKKALEIFPDNQYLQQDVLRLATKLVMSNDLPRLEKRFGQYKGTKANSGQLVILVEQGVINGKESVGINLPVFTRRDDFRYYSVALPVYRPNTATMAPLKLSVNKQSYQSETIVRLQSLAAKQLEEQLPGIVTRQVLRLISKEEIRQQLSRKGGDVGNILASLYNIASEKADTRSWSTLPDNVQIIRVNLPQGQHQLNLQQGGKNQQVEVTINANRISLINYTAMGNYTGYQTINL